MSSGYNKVLFDAVIDSDTTTVSKGFDFQSFASDLILVSTVSDRVDGTYTVTLQESPDNVNWYDVSACDAQNADGQKIKKITVTTFSFLRASILSAATTDGANVKVSLYYNHQGK